MKNKTMKTAGLAVLAGICTLIASPAWAQKTTGKLEDAEIVVEKSRVNELPEASRNFEKFKVDPPEKKVTPLSYKFTDYKLAQQDLNLNMRVLTIKPEDQTPVPGNYLKLGYGNYGTPYVKGYFHNNRDEQFSYGANISHISSSKGPVPNSGVSNSSIGLNGESYTGGLTIGGKFNYGHDKYNFYGYSPLSESVKEDSIKQLFNRISLQGYLNNKNTESPLQYQAGVGVSIFRDNFEARESNVAITLGASYALSTVSRFNIAADFSGISYQDSSKTTRGFFKLKPAYEVDGDRFDYSVGVNLAYTGDKVNDAKKMNLYPVLKVAYEVADDKLVLFGNLSGDLQRTSLYQLTQENPYLNSNLQIADVNKALDVNGGLTGNISKNLSFTARVSYLSYRNLYFFNNSATDSSRFDIVYDNDNTNVLNFFGELIYNQSEKLRLGARTEYNQYKTASLAKPYHRPATQATFFGSYNIYNKLFFNGELYYISSSYGRITRPNTGNPAVHEVLKKTDNIVDLNVKADYRFSDKFSTFVMLNNILNKKYERFVNYPTKGLNVIGGISYSF
ncbi:hypothetical protein AHMF7605_05400 [Adhaeribacter arboris]|uniref:TonB-dependent receptor n=1 Tax=Adhaeribacter arboris TaxID=2072846 RepID=A0A2T2YBV5_9BACT|nr:hypothetical protein [Adhaeribacter arboris]PSR53002.1 hypothetical protein AHMF7605_05400 [Adhaeribacter arboris]